MMVRIRGFCTVLSVLLMACTQASVPLERADGRAVQLEERPSAVADEPSASAAQSLSDQQKLIYTAELALEVDNARLSVEAADSLAVASGGLVADSRITQNADGKETATVRLRIPSQRLDEVLVQLRQLGAVRHEVLYTEDVTKDYADMETRLAVKEETGARLRHLLTSQAGNLADVLAVERELGRVTEEIELLKGERRYYDERIAYSTVTLTLVEPGALPSAGAGTPIAEALSHALEVLSTSVAWLIYLVVFMAPWVVVAGLGWWVLRRVRSRRRAV